MTQANTKVLHFIDYIAIGVVVLCLLMLSIVDFSKTAHAQSCIGTAEQCGFSAPQITQDPVLVLQRLGSHNRAYYAAELAMKNSWRSYGYDVAIPIYNARSGDLPAAAAVRGEYDLELQRRSLCAGFASNRAAGPEGVYAGRALDCRRGVFD